MFDYKTYNNVDLKGKKILLRVDINSNIDVENNKIRESPRIHALIPTLKELKNSAVVIIAHQSRPGLKDFTSLSLHAKEIKKLMDRPINYVNDVFGKKAIQAIKDLKVREVLILNNVRIWNTENKSFNNFAEAEKTEMIQALAPLFDYIIADAFGISWKIFNTRYA